MKLILNILLIIVAVSTICICAIKPDMHKNILIFDSAYKIAPDAEIESKTEVIPIMEQPAQPKPEVKLVEKKVELPKTEKTIKPTVQVKTATETKPAPKQATVSTTKTVAPTPVVKTETKTVTPKAETTVQQTTTVPKQVVKETVTTTPPPKTLTQQEEVVVWNEWRSKVQNKIMQDVKLPTLPNGIVFKFSFTVDKYGKVSNLQTWSTTAAYTPYAIQYIAPLIRSYQGRSILKFPEGSTRVTTEVTGGWKISDNTRYSTPQDYHDIEKVLK